MNNMQFPFIPPYNMAPPRPNIEEELLRLKQEINILKERITKLENQNKNDYLQKDDTLYMM